MSADKKILDFYIISTAQAASSDSSNMVTRVGNGAVFMGTMTMFDSVIKNSVAISLCQSSTITVESLTLAATKFDESVAYSVAAYTDSIDATGSHGTGTCGEKRLSLNAGSPSFLSVTPASGASAATDPFLINYNADAATEADIKTHTISYTVSSVDYSSYVSSFQDTFEFTLTCPDNVSITSATFEGGVTTLDLLADNQKTIALPSVTYSPSSCF